MNTAPLPGKANPPPFAQAAVQIRAGRWLDGLALAEADRARGEQPDATARLLIALARVRAGQAGIDSIGVDLLRDAGPGIDLRKLLISPLIQDGRLAEAAAVLATAIAAFPPARAERHQRAGMLARLGQWDKAIAEVDALSDEQPEDSALQATRIQYRLAAGEVEAAVTLVRALDNVPIDSRLANMMLLALFRHRDYATAATIVDRVNLDGVDDPALAGNVVQALFRAGRMDEAIEAGERFVDWALDGPVLRNHLAQAWHEGRSGPERFSRAIDHLEVGVTQQPDNIRMISLLGQLLLRTGKTQAAIPHLRKAVEMQPRMGEIRALYARALKQVGDYAEAAEQFATMVAQAPGGGGRWQRYAAGALAQAGRREEAADMFDAWIASRAQGLPDSFGEGLAALWDKVDSVAIPQARLDWAWGLRAPDCTLDRDEWERRAKWGHLADHYLLDWLECRDAQVEEAMYHFADELDYLEAFTAEARARAPGKGVVFASAHVGAMYFGPLALELVGERSRWIASTPSVARTSYAESLISTSDQTDTQVARAFMQALKKDNIVVVVVDGSINLAAPRMPFEGQEITFSQFAARTAHRMGSSSAFVAPVWRDGHHLGFVLEHLPMPEPDESADGYAQRWQDAYFGHLRRFLSRRPEDLRLSGGIWRHVR